jgi:hypothetical protein
MEQLLFCIQINAGTCLSNGGPVVPTSRRRRGRRRRHGRHGRRRHGIGRGNPARRIQHKARTCVCPKEYTLPVCANNSSARMCLVLSPCVLSAWVLWIEFQFALPS